MAAHTLTASPAIAARIHALAAPCAALSLFRAAVVVVVVAAAAAAAHSMVGAPTPKAGDSWR